MKKLLSQIFYNVHQRKTIVVINKYGKKEVEVLTALWNVGIIYGFEIRKVACKQPKIVVFCKGTLVKVDPIFKGTEIMYCLSWKELRFFLSKETNSIFLVKTSFGLFDIKKAYSMHLGGNLVMRCF